MNNGGQAFPRPAFYAAGAYEDGYHNEPADGMTLRDYFAAAAMQGMCSCQDFINETTRLMRERHGAVNKRDVQSEIARFAFKYADAMLAARSTPGEGT